VAVVDEDGRMSEDLAAPTPLQSKMSRKSKLVIAAALLFGVAGTALGTYGFLQTQELSDDVDSLAWRAGDLRREVEYLDSDVRQLKLEVLALERWSASTDDTIDDRFDCQNQNWVKIDDLVIFGIRPFGFNKVC
jgi:hypothetical protein